MELHGKALPEGACAEDVRAFQLLYREHCEVSADPPDTPPPRGPLPTLTPPPPPPLQAIVDVMINLQFTLVETLWKTFWRYSPGQPSDSAPVAV